MTYFIFWLQFRLSLFLSVQLTMRQYWFRQRLGDRQAQCHYLNQWWPSSLAHICGTRGRWVKLGLPTYVIKHHIDMFSFYSLSNGIHKTHNKLKMTHWSGMLCDISGNWKLMNMARSIFFIVQQRHCIWTKWSLILPSATLNAEIPSAV